MSKSTTLRELIFSWNNQRFAIHKRIHSASGHRWHEVFNSHLRKTRKQGKLRHRAAKVALNLNEWQFWSDAIRSNRKLANLPPQVFRFGNSGKPIQ